MTLTIPLVEVEITGASDPAAPAVSGDVALTGTVLEIRATLQFDDNPVFELSSQGELEPIPLTLEGDELSGLTLTMPEMFFFQTLDIGLGPDNPTIDISASLVAEEADPPCGDADLAEPAGVLDLADITAFVTFFLDADPRADFATPQGVWDLADIVAFVTAFNAGCP